jgi:hypothetical protein
LLVAAGRLMGAEPPLTFAREEGGAVVVRGIAAPDWAKVLRVSVSSRENPALLGVYEKVDGGVRFRPRFAVDGALDLVVVYDGKVERVLRGEKVHVAATTRVAAIYPSGPEAPGNLLKFYLVFDAPMARGEVWEHLRLLDELGAAVDLPFLEIDQELWDPGMKRLTLLFDPGRIKRGVLPREEVGTSLEAGKSYTLAVDKGWRDAAGQPLAAEFRHAFRVGPEERRGIDVKTWEVTASGGEIRIRFGRPMEHALALRMITVNAPGEARLEENETVWVYRVKEPRSEYAITVDHRLEDLAGNRPGRPFDVDVFERVTKKPVAETSVLRVKVR